VAEHSAQVPHNRREKIENQFKGEGEQLNTLVCTPTLELGVDIGALDSVLMRNVPPTAANYWQRAGRAGRRHRMAVDVTYAQATGFDQAYFREPLKLLGGQVEPPRFNLKNEVMIRKHVHAAVLTALHGIARQVGGEESDAIREVLTHCFPTTLKGYLFSADGNVLSQSRDVSSLKELIRSYSNPVLEAVSRAFTSAWPDEDAEAVKEEVLKSVIEEMPDKLQSVIQRFKRRLDWAREEQRKLNRTKEAKGDLDPEDKAHEKRCEKVIRRLKGSMFSKQRGSAQGGSGDSITMNALAREGFLPGYGLESGSLVGTAEPPRGTQGLQDFELPRSPTLALREYVPGNAIYANGFRFVPRRFQLTPEETLRFRVLVEQQIVQKVGVDSTEAPLAQEELRAVPVCDVIMPSQSQISDEEDFRFQLPVSVYGNDKGFHRGGTAWKWGGLDIRFRKGTQLRLVNVGPRREVTQTRLGYPLCLACGQSHSPFAGKRSREDFEQKHLERCGHIVKPTGFYADVEVDVLGLHNVEDRKFGFSVAESLRMGAARVLDMEVDDLQLLALGHVGQTTCDILMYDPMPGGSGLLVYLAERWEEVLEAAKEILEHCPGACESSCIDCLRTYRNRFYYEHLCRHTALEVFESYSGPLVKQHSLPERLPRTQTTTGQAQTYIEHRFQRFLEEAGFPMPDCQHRIDLGAGYGSTIPDFFYALDDEDEPGICIYLDGMSDHIHGNPEQASRDTLLREKLRNLDYEVVVLSSFDLDDEKAVVRAIGRIAKQLIGKEKRRELKTDTTWYKRALETSSSETEEPQEVPHETNDFPPLRLVSPTAEEKFVECVPLISLKAAAGAFSDTQSADSEWEWVDITGIARPSHGMFVAQVLGESMNRRIPNGAWCLWKANPAGSRQGKVVLAEHRELHDPEHGGRYTVKVYESEKSISADGEWEHSKVLLHPDSEDDSFEPIIFESLEDGELRIIAEFIKVIHST
jgi:phage repressor protein C with HTH and peptisase S24 domain